MSLETRLLSCLQPWIDAPAWRVALSGGLDSSVLLHLLARLSHVQQLPPLSAIHIHHGLQDQADAWAEHCRQLCAGLGVPLEIVRVRVEGGASLERAAREARYAAFRERLGMGELLLTAQHLDDQAETLLFRLLRGAGVRGLAGMQPVRALGAGKLVRPLLGITRQELHSYASMHQLDWVEDPSNENLHYSRNYLRRRVMPVLNERWPQGASALGRTAMHLREAQVLLDERADEDLAQAASAAPFPWLTCPSLDMTELSALSPARQRNALRRWLDLLGAAMPDSDHWAGWDALRDAAVDAQPVWRLAGGELRRSGARVYWLSGDWCADPPQPAAWDLAEGPQLLPGNGSLTLQGQGELPGLLQVRYRHGGERLVLAGRGQRDLKRLLNESGLPAFVRARLPLLWRGDELLAVANLPLLSDLTGSGLRLIWTPPGAAHDQAVLPPSQV